MHAGSKVDCMTLEFSRIGFAPRFVDYREAWERQKQLHALVVAGDAPSTVLLLEHAAVYTAGKRTEEHERPFDGTPVINVDRGGKLTWHGPGQLVGYPILALPDPTRIREYVDTLEEVIMRTVCSYGIGCVRIPGRSGVWVPADERGSDRKIAAVGIRVNQGATMHGFAINANNDLRPFSQIIPCGIADAGVTSIAHETDRDVSPSDIVSQVEEELSNNSKSLVRNRLLEPATAVAAAGNKEPEGELL